MSQASNILLFLLVGFVVYITINGEIPAYKTAIYGAAAPAAS